METTYHLRDNLSWQDAAPLTADDFVFAFNVYKDKALGVFIASPQDTMDAVTAPDARTVVIQWRSTNPDAGGLTFEELDPLPAHLLEAGFDDYTAGRSTGDTFLAMPFWTQAYVGAGPYRLERWDPGVQLLGRAFDGHVLGRAEDRPDRRPFLQRRGYDPRRDPDRWADRLLLLPRLAVRALRHAEARVGANGQGHRGSGAGQRGVPVPAAAPGVRRRPRICSTSASAGRWPTRSIGRPSTKACSMDLECPPRAECRPRCRSPSKSIVSR